MCVCCGTADTWSTQAVILNWCHAVCIVSSYIHQLHPKTHKVWRTAEPVSITALVFSLRQAQRIQIVMLWREIRANREKEEDSDYEDLGQKAKKKYFYLNNPRSTVPLGAWLIDNAERLWVTIVFYTFWLLLTGLFKSNEHAFIHVNTHNSLNACQNTRSSGVFTICKTIWKCEIYHHFFLMGTLKQPHCVEMQVFLI